MPTKKPTASHYEGIIVGANSLRIRNVKTGRIVKAATLPASLVAKLRATAKRSQSRARSYSRSPSPKKRAKSKAKPRAKSTKGRGRYSKAAEARRLKDKDMLGARLGEKALLMKKLAIQAAKADVKAAKADVKLAVAAASVAAAAPVRASGKTAPAAVSKAGGAERCDIHDRIRPLLRRAGAASSDRATERRVSTRSSTKARNAGSNGSEIVIYVR